MKKLNLIILFTAIVSLGALTSCGDDDSPSTPTATCSDGIMNGDETGVDCGGSCAPCKAEEVTLGGSIGTMTLDKSKVYIIDRFAYVASGDVLTIPAGTILKANNGQGADASALIVARGGKIMAEGTAEEPIIFTSIKDEIQPGEKTSTIDPTTLSQGQWGGLIILGKAPVSVKPTLSADGVGKEGYIEGVPSTFDYSKYGGNEPEDNSGVLNYVSIRYTGSTLSTDEEIQGLTLGGVGSATSINNIEIFSSFDDGVEFFGGTVNITNLLVAYQTDDAIDIDQSYAGTIDNSVVLLYNPQAGNDGLEIDGPEAVGVNDGGKFILNNTTIYQKGSANIGRLKSAAQGIISNLAAKNFSGDQTLLYDGAQVTELRTSQFNLSESAAITVASGTAPTMIDNEFDVTSFTKGADESKFAWTFSKERGDL